MKLTKYEHACFTIEKEGKLIVVDPGNLTTDLPLLDNVIGIVVTHEHQDHFDIKNIQQLVSNNPGVIVVSHTGIIEKIKLTPSKSVEAGDSLELGPFVLEFFGGEHQKPFEDSPVMKNLGVLIDEKVYHSGDSFVSPSKQVQVLLLPVSGSWMKASMARDYLYKIKPSIAIPTHDAILSEVGKEQVDKYWPLHCDNIGTTYVRPNGSIDIDG
ncbi:MAG TPA: MBL fold metallo-hydrolase [Candidatus Saccharibacteria bacterium]|nr:MBL fold metallo-hydrolase [Candidatus Saccharibacteria bacterium]